MKNMNDPFYRHSGRFGPVGMMIMLGLGAASGIVSGAIYGALIYWSPIIYLNLIGTIGAGFATGGAVYLGAVIGKVRSPIFCGLGGVIAGCAALWAAWVGWIYAYSAHGDTAVILLKPCYIWNTMAAIGREGVWGFVSSNPVKGLELYGIWIVEAVTIVGGAAYIAYVRVLGKPFCERCRRWAGKKTTLPELRPPQNARVLDGLLTGDVSGILTLGCGREGGVHIQVEVRGCGTCDETHIANISVVAESIDKKGNTETKTTHLVKNLRLSAADYQALLELKGF
ncbi:MAG: hypothetical protein QGG42_06490 [Phycisphaerae bacterium]|nr:hypothetical protein [Phycisphaerae bacterium]